jgi:hypothetical protein
MKIIILGTAKFEEGTAKLKEEFVQIGIKFELDYRDVRAGRA